jgi:hypothetical protein
VPPAAEWQLLGENKCKSFKVLLTACSGFSLLSTIKQQQKCTQNNNNGTLTAFQSYRDGYVKPQNPIGHCCTLMMLSSWVWL